MSSSDQSTTLPDVMLSVLDGLLTLAADPTAGARFAELTVARAKVLEAEQHLESDRAAFGAHEERVRSDLARLNRTSKSSESKLRRREVRWSAGRNTRPKLSGYGLGSSFRTSCLRSPCDRWQ